MHGRKRSEYKALQRDPTVAASLRKKAQQWHALSAELQTRRRQIILSAAVVVVPNTNDPEEATTTTSPVSHDATNAAITATTSASSATATMATTSMELLDKLLTVNPDPLYLWNHRRELLLLPNGSTTTTTSDNNTSRLLTLDQVQRERQVTLTALQNNSKAYGPWFHRKWILSEWIQQEQQQPQTSTTPSSSSSEPPAAAPALVVVGDILKQELDLTSEFLKLDERNFHGWSYRRFIVALLLEQEHDGTGLLLEERHHPQDGLDPKNNAQLQFLCGPLDGSWTYQEAVLSSPSSSSCPGEAAAVAAKATATRPATTTTTTTLMGAQVSYHHAAAAAATSTGTMTINANQSVPLQWLQHEWDFSLQKIRDNFSNFSAFHYRSKLLPLQLQLAEQQQPKDDMDNENAALTMLQTELELVQNAVFTEPDDQTAWWYQRFLLQQFAPWSSCHPGSNKRHDTQEEEVSFLFLTTWQQHVEALQELAAEVTSSKWVVLGILICLQQFPQQQQDNGETALIQQQQDLLQKLLQLDPDRRVRYQHLLRKLRQRGTSK